MLQLIDLQGDVQITQSFVLTGNIQCNQSYSLVGDVIVGVSAGKQYPDYEGEYVVTPYAFRQTVLDTDEKVMHDDVTVLEVPYTETSNLYGTTVAIATE